MRIQGRYLVLPVIRSGSALVMDRADRGAKHSG
jgi:hypothetical protein